MTTSILAYFPSPAQGVWHLGPVPIRAYALFIIIGIITALMLGDRRWEARGGERGVIYDIALWAVPFGLIGGRLYHVITDWRTYFGDSGAGAVAALRIWDGGLGIWGAVALGGVGAWIGCRRHGIPLPAFGDAIAPGIVLAQAIGRIGNYFNQELYGRETTVPWGLEIFYRRDPSGIVDVHSLEGVSNGQLAYVVHPTFLYELLCNLVVFVLLIYLDRRFKIGHGRLFALYVAGYCVGRFCVELLRDDAATHIDGIRINSFTATFVFIGAIVYFILAPKGREDPASLQGNRDEEDSDEVPELAKELVAVAATSGVVAAATVAGEEDADAEPEAQTDGEAEPEAAAESEAAADAEPEAEPDAEPEAVADAEPAAEADAEPEAEPDAEPAAEADAEAEPEAEDAEDAEDDADPEPEAQTDGEAESEAAAEPEAEADAEAEPEAEDADDIEDADDEAVVEAEVTSESGIQSETAVEAEDADSADEDHDEVDEADLEGAAEVSAEDGPLSEQAESGDDLDAEDDETDDVDIDDVDIEDGDIEDGDIEDAEDEADGDKA